MIAFAGQQAGQAGEDRPGRTGQDRTGQDKIGQDRTGQSRGEKGRALLLLLTKTQDPERCR